jgi:uncharacterized protein
MSIEVSPVGVTCNLSCPYCYEHPMREAGNFNDKPYDLDKMIAGLEKEGGKFGLFGGEPLLTDIETLEGLWKFGLEKFGYNQIQTNGTLINDKHIELFKKYKVHVGISVDGPDELNDTRWAGSLEETRKRTKLSMNAAEKLCDEGIPPSFIVTLHKLNATPEKLPRLKEWFKYWDSRGVYGARLHTLEVEYDSINETLALSDERNIEVMLEMAELEKELIRIRFDVFNDIKKILIGLDSAVTCTFNECDPYTTDAVRGINGQGESENCGRANKEGINFFKADQKSYERQMALYNTPQEYGGCKDCRFFVMCKGQCPGTGIKYDWRNKTDKCEMYFKLFEHFERKYEEAGVLPLSKSPELKRIESIMYNAWTKQKRCSIENNAFPILRNLN